MVNSHTILATLLLKVSTREAKEDQIMLKNYPWAFMVTFYESCSTVFNLLLVTLYWPLITIIVLKISCSASFVLLYIYTKKTPIFYVLFPKLSSDKDFNFSPGSLKFFVTFINCLMMF